MASNGLGMSTPHTQQSPMSMASMASMANMASMPSTPMKSPQVGMAGSKGDFIYIKHEDGQHVLLPTALAQQLTQYTPAGILPSSPLMKKARKRAPNWSNEEQACLVSIWSAPEMQEKFKKATRKWPLWEEMGKMLERAGFYGRDAKQCEALMHRLKSTYYRCVNHNRQPGNEPQYCAFYSEIDAVLSQKDACKSYVESDEESRVSEGEMPLDTGGDSDEEKGNNCLSQNNLKQFVEQLAENHILQAQLTSQLNIKSPYSPATSNASGTPLNPCGSGAVQDGKLPMVDYTALMKLLRTDVKSTSPRMADSTTMSSPGVNTVNGLGVHTPTASPADDPRMQQQPHGGGKRPRVSSPSTFTTEDYLQSILAQSHLQSLQPNKLCYPGLNDMKLLNGGARSPGVTAHDLERVCTAVTDRMLEYLQARDQAFLSLGEKRMRVEEERERRRMEREAEIELKRHQLIVKVCELITKNSLDTVPFEGATDDDMKT